VNVVVIERTPRNDAMLWLSALTPSSSHSSRYVDPSRIVLPNRAEIRLLLDLLIPTPAPKEPDSSPAPRLTEEQVALGRGAMLR
jgi:hypothetical protein